MSNEGWIGVDLDGTLAEYDGWISEKHIGKPVPLMVNRVKRWLDLGFTVKIMTARVSHPGVETEKTRERIREWLVEEAGLPPLEVTCIKDYNMIELYDDRAVQVIPNTGKLVGTSTRGIE